MKITIRPLKGDTFDVEVEPDAKVEALKQKIASLKPESPVELQKLICAGKILADSSSISEHGIKPTDFVVLMTSKAPKPAGPAAAAPAAAPAATPAAVPAAPAAASAPADPTAASTPTTVAAPAGGGSNEGAIVQLCEMGFPREEVEKCMRAAFNNPDRAVEYLTNGIPANMVARPRSRSRSPHGHGGGGHGHGHEAGHGGDDAGHNCGEDHGAGHECSGHGHADGHAADGQGHGHVASSGGRDGSAFPAVPAGGGGDGEGESDALQALQAIRNNPHFERLRSAVLENPDVLPGLLQGLAATQPELAQAISANQEEFLLMLQSDEGDDDDGREDEAHGDGHAHGGAAGQTVHVSEADRSAMERLAALGGFPPERALEAYLACDRNEELAANLLFDATMD